MSIEFKGATEIIAKLDKVIDGASLEKAMGQACDVVVRSAKQKVPKDTGALRRSIQSKVESSNTEIKGVVFSPLEYSAFVEFGTGLGAYKQYGSGKGRKDVPWFYKDDKGKTHITWGQEPQPYLRPALNENREKIVETFKRGLTE